MPDPDLVAFLSTLRSAGAPLELEPWQSDLLAGRFRELQIVSPRTGRKRETVEAIALAALMGHDVAIAAADTASARATYDAALELLERAGRLGLDATRARARIARPR